MQTNPSQRHRELWGVTTPWPLRCIHKENRILGEREWFKVLRVTANYAFNCSPTKKMCFHREMGTKKKRDMLL